MKETIATLIPILTLFAAPAGAGALSSWFFDWLRTRYPLPPEPISLAYKLLYAPAYARVVTIVIGGLISIVASGAVAGLAGQDVLSAIDVALAALLGALSGQLRHGLSLSTEVKRS